MESRRNRRRRGGACPVPVFQPPQPARSSKFFGFIQALVILGSIAAILYMMMEYHCSACNSSCEVKKLSKNIDQLAGNLTRIHEFYVALERRVRQCSQDLLKVEGQVERLESLAKSLVSQRQKWNPKSHLTLPDVKLNPLYHKCHNSLKLKNCTKIPLPCRKASQVQ